MRFQRDNPRCCFCGGSNPTESIDHQPAAIFFGLKRRPKGLEFPACSRCNGATSQDEQVAALMARMFPDAIIEEERAELRDLLRATRNNHPGLLEQLLPNADQVERFRNSGISLPPGGGLLSAEGALVNRSMVRVGIKLALALHYEFTGNIIPPSGGVMVRWFSNYDAISGGIPSGLFDVFREPMTLTQGKWSVPEQFHWYGAASPSGETGMFFAAFRRSFGIAMFTKHDRTEFPNIDGMNVHVPGAL